MLEIRNATIQMRKDGRTLADGLYFTLHAGDRAALIGEEGNGKSTLLKWIFDPNLVAGYAEAAGQRIADGKMGYLPQELAEADMALPVCAYLDESCGYYSLSPRDVERAAKELGVPASLFDEGRSMGTLSGGEGFFTSLALALGLSDTVQNHAGGRQMDALFIDEGFGTLSDDVLDRALDVLNQLTEGNRLVGIISHVDKLDESIAQKVRVKNTGKGSALTLELP